MGEETLVVKRGVDVFDDRGVICWHQVTIVEPQYFRHSGGNRKREGSKENSGRKKDRVARSALVRGTDDVAPGAKGQSSEMLRAKERHIREEHIGSGADHSTRCGHQRREEPVAVPRIVDYRDSAKRLGDDPRLVLAVSDHQNDVVGYALRDPECPGQQGLPVEGQSELPAREAPGESSGGHDDRGYKSISIHHFTIILDDYLFLDSKKTLPIQ